MPPLARSSASLKAHVHVSKESLAETAYDVKRA